MINTTDLSEIEILLPGDWLRVDNGDIYSFTIDKMQIRDERLFRQLLIRHPSQAEPDMLQYALTIIDDFCGVMINEDEFIIRQIGKMPNGSANMEWEDGNGLSIKFKLKN
jgi:hypothetical protein